MSNVRHRDELTRGSTLFAQKEPLLCITLLRSAIPFKSITWFPLTQAHYEIGS